MTQQSRERIEMNKNSTYTLVVAIVTLLSGCINSDLSHCGKQAQLVIKAVNKYGDDITPSGATGGMLCYLFSMTKIDFIPPIFAGSRYQGQKKY